MTTRPRHVLHVDMDAFYASIEQRDDPALRGQPLVVGGGSNRGVVAAASYEARVHGIRSAMPMREAMRRCPGLLRVKPRMDHYREVSGQIFAIFREFTPLVEGLSLDEAFLDVTDSIRLFGAAEQIAANIKSRIHETTGLTASVGVAPNKLVAKIASDLDKPDGLVVVTADRRITVLDPLPVSVIPGIGRKTLDRLQRENIRLIRDLRTAAPAVVERVFGRYAARMQQRAAGIDDRPVQTGRPGKSLSAEETFGTDLKSVADMQRELLRLAERVAARLRRKQLVGGTVIVKIREADFTTHTRRRSLQPPASDTAALYEQALGLLQLWLAEHPDSAIRLLGVGAGDLDGRQQPDLFDGGEAGDRDALDRTADEIRERFSALRLGRARTFKNDQIG